MKTLKTILILFTILIFSCDSNDDAQTDPATPSDGFMHNNVFRETANAYLEIDEDDDNPADGFPDEYNFFFIDGRMADGDSSLGAPTDADEYIFTLNTSNFVFFNLKVLDNPSLANSVPQAGNTYNGDVYSAPGNTSPDTVIVEDYLGTMESLSTPYFIDGLEYGNPSSDDSTNAQGPNNATPLLTVNAININSTNPSQSTINVDYVYVNNLGEIFTGHYEGTLGVFQD
ncbi:hypothetical protein [uncultured Winogradskyella sp.]|uniref:hypothetical protein n=1 Tax=uncultured Winogradskyella sp. TaxID=395353 RepID=UPI0030ECAAE2|tara:strand:- start:398 stop:1084 length:687 start_codon:yes stop_codon:yes gene_type:complete